MFLNLTSAIEHTVLLHTHTHSMPDKYLKDLPNPLTKIAGDSTEDVSTKFSQPLQDKMNLCSLHLMLLMLLAILLKNKQYLKFNVFC